MLTPDRTRADAGLPGYPRPGQLVRVTNPYAEVHHSAVARHYHDDPAEVLREIDGYHRRKNWNGIFYALMVDRAGLVWEARGQGYRSIGSHQPFYSDGTRVNPNALCVLLPGDYRTDPITAAQQATLRRLFASMPDTRPRWHQMRAATSCPGHNVIAFLLAIDTKIPDRSDMILGPGSTGEEVVYLQRILAFWGYLPTENFDGRYGARTADAVRNFKGEIRKTSRRPHLLGDTGKWGPRTYEEYGAWLERLA